MSVRLAIGRHMTTISSRQSRQSERLKLSRIRRLIRFLSMALPAHLRDTASPSRVVGVAAAYSAVELSRTLAKIVKKRSEIFAGSAKTRLYSLVRTRRLRRVKRAAGGARSDLSSSGCVVRLSLRLDHRVAVSARPSATTYRCAHGARRLWLEPVRCEQRRTAKIGYCARVSQKPFSEGCPSPGSPPGQFPVTAGRGVESEESRSLATPYLLRNSVQPKRRKSFLERTNVSRIGVGQTAQGPVSRWPVSRCPVSRWPVSMGPVSKDPVSREPVSMESGARDPWRDGPEAPCVRCAWRTGRGSRAYAHASGDWA